MKSNRIHIILIFLIILLIVILICGRQLCNLINGNTTDDENYYRKRLIGTWHETPNVGAGYGVLYKFSNDGTFTYSYSQFNSEKRVLDLSGKWNVTHGNLLSLEIISKTVIEGGEFDKYDNASASYTLRNGSIKIINLTSPETVLYPLSELQDYKDKAVTSC